MKSPIDADGQPVNRAFNAARLSDRSIDELVGFCRALLIDDRIDEQEARALQRWVEQNRHVAENWPADILYQRVSAMLSDGDFSSEESRELLELVREVTGGDIPSSGASRQLLEHLAAHPSGASTFRSSADNFA